MADFEETWSEEDFYKQSVNIWIKFLAPNEWNFQLGLEPMDLFTAASSSTSSQEKVENIIFRQNFDLNKSNGGNWTPLMYAAYYGHEDVVNLLLKNGASPHPCNKMGKNALMIAARCGIDPVVETLIKYGGILEARDREDYTVIFHAIFSENSNVLQILLKYKANPNACVRHSGMTPLMYAARLGYMEMVTLLLKSGAVTTFTSDKGKTAAMMAKEANFPAITELINYSTLHNSSIPSLKDGPEAVEYRFTKHQQYLLPAARNSNSYSLNPSCGVVSDLPTLLSHIGLEAYTSIFREQQVDLQVFLTMNDQELKECGVNKIGPRRKMIAAIARWHSNAPLRYGLEAAFANKVEVEYQQACEKLTEMETFAKSLKGRLDEANNRCRIMREQLSSAVLISYYNYDPQRVSERLNVLSSLLEDLFRITSSSAISNEKAVTSS